WGVDNCGFRAVSRGLSAPVGWAGNCGVHNCGVRAVSRGLSAPVGWAGNCRVHNCGVRAVSGSLSAPVGWSTTTQVVALDMVGVDSLKREEVILHLVEDAIRDLALSAPTPTAPEHRSVVCLTCPDQRLILHVKQLDAPLVLVVVAFYKGPGKDVVRIFPFHYDDERQFLFHDLRRNKRMKIALHRLDENLRAVE